MGMLCMTIKRYLSLANLVLRYGFYFVLVPIYQNFYVMTKS
jgi:hypothetical protein